MYTKPMWLYLSLVFAAVNAFAEPARTPHVTAELVSEYSQLSAGKANWVGLRLEMIPHWHTYWKFPGDSGLPTKIIWNIPAAWKISEARWEIPERIEVPPLVNFGYSGETLIGFELEIPVAAKPGAYDLAADASWLVCREECVPEKVKLHFRVMVGAERKKTFLAHEFEKLRAQQPRGLAGLAVRREEKRIGLEFTPEVKFEDIDFFPSEGGVVDGKAPPKKEGSVFWMNKADPFDQKATGLRGIWVAGKPRASYVVDQKFNASAVGGDSPGFLLALLFAFFGGVLLNFMPCVFPVLGIKVMSLIDQDSDNPWRARFHGKVYALGVLVSFWLLTAILIALRSAGEAVGWGFQLQEPAVVIALAFLFLGLAGNLGGFFEVGGRWMGFGSRLVEREGWTGSFFTGVLAVVVATPCSAPLMGSAIGLVLSEPAWAIFGVFTFLALGLAGPFVLLAYWPALLHKLPRPGNWMVRMKEFFAFPMLATMIWLLWVLGQQRGLNAVIITSLGLLLLCLAAWLQLKFRARAIKTLAFLIALGAFLVGFFPVGFPAVGVGEVSHSRWTKYSDQALEAALREGKPVFVDFTAAWCLTCQVNKAVVLDRDPTQNFFRKNGVVALLADWTNHDQEITDALARYGRIGLPLYLSFPKGRREAKILPQVLTEKIVREGFQD